MGSAVSGLFGVNLQSNVKTSEPWFVGIFASVAVVFVLGNAFGLLWLKRRGVLVT